MQTKYLLRQSKHVDSSRWQHVVNIDFPRPKDQELDSGFAGYYKRQGGWEHWQHSAKTEFRKFMQQQYGECEQRYSIRWTDTGADVRFQDDADAASFLMFFTRDPGPDIRQMNVMWHRAAIVFKDGNVMQISKNIS